MKNFSILYRCRCLKLKGRIGNIEFYVNPISTLVGAFVLWAFVIWAMIDLDQSIVDINVARGWITDKCTWLVIYNFLAAVAFSLPLS